MGLAGCCWPGSHTQVVAVGSWPCVQGEKGTLGPCWFHLVPVGRYRPPLESPTQPLLCAQPQRSHLREQKWLTSLPHHRASPLYHHPAPTWAHPCIPIHAPFGHSIPIPVPSRALRPHRYIPIPALPGSTSPSPVLSILIPPSPAPSPHPVPVSPPPCSHHRLQMHLGSKAPPQVLCPDSSVPRKQRGGRPAPSLAPVCLHSRSALNIFHLAQCKCLR